MFKITLLVVVVLIVGVLAFAATKPDNFHVERSIRIQAPPEKIFPLIDDLKAWALWSPYEKKDPAMKRVFGSITQGKGATYAWSGDKNIGEGSMEITESTPSSRLALDLHFLKPFQANNRADFVLIPDGDGTKLTWSIDGPSPFISKLMGLFFNIDKMIGDDYEAGLASLKAIAES